jgi:transcriptional regulator with XRE-family HTH domain
MANRTNFWEIMRAKTQEEIAQHLSVKQGSVSRLKAGERGLSPEIARKIAFKTGENAPTLYLTSQLASMERGAATKSLSPAGWFGSAQHVARNISKKFLPEELKAAKADPEFIAAATRLRELLLRALDLLGEPQQMGPVAGSGNDQGPTYRTGDSLAPALKNTRDAQGVRIKDGESIERDAYGRRIGR